LFKDPLASVINLLLSLGYLNIDQKANKPTATAPTKAIGGGEACAPGPEVVADAAEAVSVPVLEEPPIVKTGENL
jgi:hypothetical protein